MAKRYPIALKRVYEPAEPDDGIRILVERLWPRGLSKEKAKVDHWLKDLAPSAELRKWFQHDVEKWEEFKSKYFEELSNQVDGLEGLLDLIKSHKVTLVFASKEERFNNSNALVEFIENFMRNSD